MINSQVDPHQGTGSINKHLLEITILQLILLPSSAVRIRFAKGKSDGSGRCDHAAQGNRRGAKHSDEAIDPIRC